MLVKNELLRSLTLAEEATLSLSYSGLSDGKLANADVYETVFGTGSRCEITVWREQMMIRGLFVGLSFRGHGDTTAMWRLGLRLHALCRCGALLGCFNNTFPATFKIPISVLLSCQPRHIMIYFCSVISTDC